MRLCRARVFHDAKYNWYWYCYDCETFSEVFENVPVTLSNLHDHKRNVQQMVEAIDTEN